MGVLEGFEPKKVFHYFEEIAKIPHGSGDTKRISDYIAGFAKERNLRYVQDQSNNIILWKEAYPGYENSALVILQGHLDMVCEKEDGVSFDFQNDGLRLTVQNGMISAEGTTLGGDDGIAVAYALAILDAEDIVHPPLEVVLTADEEIGMLGAAALDMTLLKGRRMINLDSEEEGYLLVSCAGGVTSKVKIPICRVPFEGTALRMTVSGLMGGHSGMEIDQGRANANGLLGRVLYRARQEAEFRLCRVSGGLKDNAIPRGSEAILVCRTKNDREAFSRVVRECMAEISKEYEMTDSGIQITVENSGISDICPMDEASTRQVIAALFCLPSGIERMSFAIPGMVQTSLNFGILETGTESVLCSFSVRSSAESEKNALVDKLSAIAELLGGTVETCGAYPAWEYRSDSPLRDVCVSVFRSQYGKAPIVHAIHAGVECGLFAGALRGLDAVSLGPDMKDIHTPKEIMDIESVRRTWEYLLKVLKALK